MERPTDSTKLDAVFDALRNPYRRRILFELSEHSARDGDAFSLEEFARMERPADSTRLDAVFDALRDPDRRRILFELSDHGAHDGDPSSLEEFATGDEGSNELRTALYHCHLPKLAANGYVEWDPDSGQIRQGANFDEIAPFLAVVLGYENGPSVQ